jgi:hypothetical protein
MPANEFVRGVKEIDVAITAMQRRVDLATVASLKKVTALARTSVRSGMRGRPRWDRRGDGPGGPAVNLDLTPHHRSKSGGPGKLDGVLYNSVMKTRKPRVKPGGASAAVFMGGAKANPQVNWYKRELEGKFPYFRKGIEKGNAKYPAVWNAAWAKATKTK